MRKRSLDYSALIFFVAVALVAVMKTRNDQRVTAERSSRPSLVDSTREPASLSPAASRGVAVTESAPKFKPQVERPFAHELEVYTDLKRKVFLTETEKATMASYLKDAKILQGIGQRLTDPLLSTEVSEEQNAAIDLVMEALRSGNSTVASEILTKVVADTRVENPALARSERENLGGLKGQVLYLWTALKPDQAPDIARQLPGPVSQKIWENVQEAQRSNIAQSADLDR